MLYVYVHRMSESASNIPRGLYYVLTHMLTNVSLLINWGAMIITKPYTQLCTLFTMYTHYTVRVTHTSEGQDAYIGLFTRTCGKHIYRMFPTDHHIYLIRISLQLPIYISVVFS